MGDFKKLTPRRSILKYAALSAVGIILAPGATIESPAPLPAGDYQVIDQRKLYAGGLGLFIVTTPNPTREQLKALGEQLREQFGEQANVEIEVFDDAEAARTVRTGSRMVGEERFSIARGRQKASYRKSVKPPRNEFIIYGEGAETFRY